MNIALELDPKVERIMRARAAAEGLSLEDYLPSIIAEVFWQKQYACRRASSQPPLGHAGRR